MGYLPSGWDSGDEATGPQMDEITTVVLARRPAPERVRSAAPATPTAGRGSQCHDGLRACSCCCARNGTCRAHVPERYPASPGGQAPHDCAHARLVNLPELPLWALGDSSARLWR